VAWVSLPGYGERARKRSNTPGPKATRGGVHVKIEALKSREDKESGRRLTAFRRHRAKRKETSGGVKVGRYKNGKIIWVKREQPKKSRTPRGGGGGGGEGRASLEGTCGAETKKGGGGRRGSIKRFASAHR